MTVSFRVFIVSIAIVVVSNFSGPARAQSSCDTARPESFTVRLPVLGYPPDDEGQGWDRPKVWDGYPDAADDSVTIPNGRPIYALIVSGYASNKHLDELMLYNFARHLQQRGAYVHWSWWNNLLAPYMERPLHHAQSEPGDLNAHLGDFTNMTAEDAGRKALPSEDYQFLADAKLLLTAIRTHNPNAIIIVAGHSMGGGAVVHLGSQTGELIDILAPIDPVGNRNYPFAGNDRLTQDDFNWTRWRISRDNFLGYKKSDWDRDAGECVPTGPWLDRAPLVGSDDVRCVLRMFVDDPPTLVFGSNIINLYHRYQQEFLFPFDYGHAYPFGHFEPPNGSTSQEAVEMTHEFCGGLTRCPDPGGWPALTLARDACCFTGDGVGWPKDGHGEIVGYRGPLPDPVPLGVRVRTSPECGAGCDNLTWPERYKDNGKWVNGDGAQRTRLLKALETLPAGTEWSNRPTNPALCLVSPGLIALFDRMNKPPTADAGPDQVVECTGHDGTAVVLDGSASSDPDGDDLTYSWEWPTGSATGVNPTVSLPLGTYCITLTVGDPSGHIDRDVVVVNVVDTTPPDLTVELYPNSLWPPNHKMADIQAAVHAEDLCGDVASLTLVSVVSSEPDNGRGDGNTTGDIAGAEINTLDTLFQLRSERQGGGDGRIYTVTYQATDESGNRAEVSADVVVKNLPPGKPRGLTVAYHTGEGNLLGWRPSADPDFSSFAIYRSFDPSFASGPGEPADRTASTSWRDPRYDGTDVYYRVTAIDQTGLESPAAYLSGGVSGEIKRSHDVLMGANMKAPPGQDQNYPNPFNPSTVIGFHLTGDARVRLRVFNTLGQEVATLADGVMDAGDHSVVWDAGDAPAGVYFYRLEISPDADPGSATFHVRKMVLMK
jgi:pimeloyl-ACP methyl ester carboxylesterase